MTLFKNTALDRKKETEHIDKDVQDNPGMQGLGQVVARLLADCQPSP